MKGTPAADAGMKPGDLITEFNGKKVADYRALRLAVSQTKPKAKASFKVLRDGKVRTVNVTLAELPSQRVLSGMIRPDGKIGRASCRERGRVGGDGRTT